MRSRTIAYLISEGFLPHVLVSIESARAAQGYNGDVNIAYFAAELPPKHIQQKFGLNVYWHLMGEVKQPKEIYRERPRFMLQLFSEGYDAVIHLGADVVFYPEADAPILSDDEPSRDLIQVTFHCKFPPGSPVALHRTGLLNSDYVCWGADASYEFLKWQDKQLEFKNDDKDGYFFDQVYLDFILSYKPWGLLYSDSARENRAYYNIHEKFERANLASFQFSGFLEHAPTLLSKFLFGQKHLTPDIVRLCIEYGVRLAGARERLRG